MRDATSSTSDEEYRSGGEPGQGVPDATTVGGAVRSRESGTRESAGRRWRYASAVQAARALQTG